MDRPVLDAIRQESFEPLGWFAPRPEDAVPALPDGRAARFAMLIGNAGPTMFARFATQRDAARDRLDDWCREVLSALAERLGATAFFPFDDPPLPFPTWARRAGAGHASPLGLNIHHRYGLWHAYRALFAFGRALDLPPPEAGPCPCETCPAKPCLQACPVGAFTPQTYAVGICVEHIATPAGGDCMAAGCLARRACPVGQAYAYEARQAAFHMAAFLRARQTRGG